MKNLLLTGGGGFIATNFIRYVLELDAATLQPIGARALQGGRGHRRTTHARDNRVRRKRFK